MANGLPLDLYIIDNVVKIRQRIHNLLEAAKITINTAHCYRCEAYNYNNPSIFIGPDDIYKHFKAMNDESQNIDFSYYVSLIKLNLYRLNTVLHILSVDEEKLSQIDTEDKINNYLITNFQHDYNEMNNAVDDPENCFNYVYKEQLSSFYLKQAFDSYLSDIFVFNIFFMIKDKADIKAINQANELNIKLNITDEFEIEDDSEIQNKKHEIVKELKSGNYPQLLSILVNHYFSSIFNKALDDVKNTCLKFAKVDGLAYFKKSDLDKQIIGLKNGLDSAMSLFNDNESMSKGNTLVKAAYNLII